MKINNQPQKSLTADNCKNCFTCQQGVDKSVTVLNRPKPTPENCKNCFDCQQNVGKDASATSGRSKLTADNCKNCFTCQQGVDKSVTALDKQPGKVTANTPFVWYLFPTNACNLRCTYCYANNKPGKMTSSVMHKTLHWLFEKQPYKNLTCHFFGGEPTTMWNMLTDMVEMGGQMGARNGHKIVWSMTTNGTLLDEDKLQWIKAKFRKNNPFLLSIDGRPETHDKYRVDAQGNGTHHLIPVKRILELFPTIECRPTIMPDTAKDWFEDFKWLRNQGFRAIAIEPNYEDPWTMEQLRDYENLMEQMADYYYYAKTLGSPIPMKFIDNVVRGLQQEASPSGMMCGTANNCGAIDHRGEIYACQRYASYNDPKEYSIGDVENGWDEFKLYKTRVLSRQSVMGDVSAGNNCKTCEIEHYCFKGCNAANQKFMGRRDVALPVYCTLSKIEVKVALGVISRLGLLAFKGNQKPQGGCRV